MVSEEKTKHLVLADLGIDPNEEYPEFHLIIQGVKENEYPEIEEILKEAGGKNQEFKGKGRPEYIIRLENEEKVLLIECKADRKNHQSPNLDKPEKFNVDGTLHYAKHFKKKFDTLFLVVSGVQRNKLKISFGIWKKGENTYRFIEEQTEIFPWKDYFVVQKEGEKPIEYGKIRTIAREINEIFHSESWGLDDKQKPFFISACLLVLDNKNFRKDFFQSEEQLKEKYKVNDLVSFCKSTIETEIKKLLVEEKDKAKYKSLKNNLLRTIDETEKLTEIKNEKETYFVSILRKINKEVYPYFVGTREDIIGTFYHEFLKYSSSSDGKVLGITLTPSHIAELFCDLALKLLYPNVKEEERKFTEKDKILDICCGTGTFLVSALSKGTNPKNIYGIELNQNVYDLVLTNMILWGDGRSNISRTSCFDEKKKKKDKIEDKIKKAKCNIGFLNPPYSLKKSEKSEGKSEIKFIHHLCNSLEPESLVFAIVPLSVAIGNKSWYKEERKEIMKEHTLKAVMTMPPDLFSANKSGSHTCIMVWKTGTAHNEQVPTWLANWKDDGFVPNKGKREPRTDGIWEKKDAWKERKKEWLDMYWQDPIQYVSTFQNLTAKDTKKNEKTRPNTCWLADAYVETNYLPLTKEGGELYFEKTIRDYLAFLISNFHSPIKKIANLNTNNWKYFYLNEKDGYFKIWRGKWKESLESSSPKILFDYNSVVPIISSSQENNGVNNFVEKDENQEVNLKNRITIANNGSVGETFFQPLDFQATSDITILELINQELNEYIAFFLCSIIKMERFRYSWGRKWGLEEMRNSRIKLPQDENGRPDWKFMENYSKEIFLKVKEDIYQITERERERERERKIKNSAPKWEEVKIIDYFHVEGTKTTKKEDVEPREVSYISNKNTFNGYECSSRLGTEDGNVISVSDFGAGAFYQETRFSCTYHVEKVYPRDKELNKYTALFLTTLLNWGADKYSYGRIRNLQELKNEKILLPIRDKKIDWEYIENMMKSLYKDVVVGLEKDLESIENKIIWRIIRR